MKLIKIKDDHYVVVDDSKIDVGDWYIDDAKQIRQSVVSDEVYWQHRPYNREYMKITHSTQPLDERRYWGKVMPLTLTISEIKELLGEVDKVVYHNMTLEQMFWAGHYDFVKGYNQAIEDNKEKKFSEDDISYAIGLYLENKSIKEIIQSLQPKTEWEVEIVDGKLKLI